MQTHFVPPSSTLATSAFSDDRLIPHPAPQRLSPPSTHWAQADQACAPMGTFCVNADRRCGVAFLSSVAHHGFLHLDTRAKTADQRFDLSIAAQLSEELVQVRQWESHRCCVST